MFQNSENVRWKHTLGRIVLFCICSAIVLATASRVSQEISGQWSQYLLVTIAIIITFSFTIVFVRWQGLRLRDVGIVPDHRTVFYLTIGFLIGIILAGLQPALVLLTGHLKLVLISSVNSNYVVLNFLLYLLIAFREELAFRAFPLRSLNYVTGSWKAQLIIALIFALEHKIGGYTWTKAFLGAGVGSLLFGIAALISKGIALPVGIHAAWNFGQWCLGFKNESGLLLAVADKGYEGQIETVSFVCYLLIMGLTIFAFYFYSYKTRIDLKGIEP